MFYLDFGSGSYTGYLTNSTEWQTATGDGSATVEYLSWNASVRNDNYGSAGNIGTYDGASGHSYVRLTHSNGKFGYLTICNINTCGFSNFNLNFGAAQGSDVMRVEASADGEEWTSISYSCADTYNHWGPAHGSFSVSGVSKLYLRFSLLMEYSTSYKYGANIDDIRLSSSDTPSGTVIYGNGGGDVQQGINKYAELPVFDNSNKDYYYNTLFATTARSNKTVRNYSFCYDKRRHNPIWVAFPMHSIYAEGSGRSKDDYGNDPWQPYPGLDVSEQSIIWDIAGTGYMYWTFEAPQSQYRTWTKGHLCMSSSRAGANLDINLQTFYPVNIAPQTSAAPFGTLWGKTEDLHWQRGSEICPDTLYVVAGCHYADEQWIEYDAANYNDHSSYSKPCVIPSHQYKLFLRTRSGYTGKAVQDCTADQLKSIAFLLPSIIPAGYSEDIADYAVSVEEIEKLTGITFFPGIPEAVKQQCEVSDWSL
ncbi:MAG: DNA/RNA non-specific endonuclease [Bacteroidales bacterium]|nr:DNA/RNA non-specific endonuclease [Bacteroidales bacterium]